MYVRSRGVKRKQSFKKAKRKQIIFIMATKNPIKEIGRFRKGIKINHCYDGRKTNSEICGKRNYKYGDMKRYLSCEEQIKNYRGVL